VNNELSGYDTKSQVPEYRQCVGNVSGSYINGNYQFNDQQLPTAGLPQKVEDAFRSMDFYQSAETLEALKRENKSGTLEALFPAELTNILQQHIRKMGNPDLQIIQAKKWVSGDTNTFCNKVKIAGLYAKTR
jgi:hypothetical protein